MKNLVVLCSKRSFCRFSFGLRFSFFFFPSPFVSLSCTFSLFVAFPWVFGFPSSSSLHHSTVYLVHLVLDFFFAFLNLYFSEPPPPPRPPPGGGGGELFCICIDIVSLFFSVYRCFFLCFFSSFSILFLFTLWSLL